MSYSDTKTQPRTIADIVREKTNDGELIVDFLVDMVLGKIEGASLWHRLEATRQLQRLGLELPNAVQQAVSPPANGRKPERAPVKPRPEDELAEIIREKTDGGKDIVQFLIDAMQGKLEDFKPRHRLAASDRLITRGFDNAPDSTTGDDGEHDAVGLIHTVNRQATEQTVYSGATCDDCRTSPLNCKDDPFDFDNYDYEQYERDRCGERALAHIYGGDDAERVAYNAAEKNWRYTRPKGLDTDRDSTPIENPEDDPYGKGHYGYRALKVAYGDNDSVRVATKAAAEYHRRKFKHLLNDDGSLNALADTSSLDTQTLQYLERSPHLLVDDDGEPQDIPVGEDFNPSREYGHCRDCSSSVGERLRPSRDPGKPPAEHDPEHPNDTTVGEGFKPSRDPQPVTPEPQHVILSEAEGSPAPKPPPKKIRRIIHLGPPSEDDPPDEDLRRYRDPDEIRVPLKDLLTISARPP